MSHHPAARLLPGAAAVAGFLLVVVAVLLAGGPAHALQNCDVDSFSIDSEEALVIDLINDYRAQNGASALTQSTNLNRAAQWMANDMAVNGYFGHTDSLGRAGYTRSMDCGYPQGAGENLAASGSWDTAAEALQAWKNSPGHNQNMLLPFYRQIGVARVYAPGSVYGYYWVTEFGATNDGTDGTGGGSSGGTATPTNTPVPPTPEPNVTQVAGPVIITPGQGGASGGSQGGTDFAPAPGATSAAPAGAAQAPFTPTPGSPRWRGSTPANTPESVSRASVTLRAGANLVTWPGKPAAPWAIANQAGGRAISIIYTYDAAKGAWLRYSPRLAGPLNTLTELKTGAAYWVVTSEAGVVVTD